MSEFPRRNLMLALLVAVLLAACSFDGSPLRALWDAGAADPQRTDTAVHDQAVARQDGSGQDSLAVDLSKQDSADKDSKVPDQSQSPDQQQPDQSPDQQQPDVRQSDANADNCTDIYGNIHGYHLCGQDATSCTFYFNVSPTKSCQDICTSHGASCLKAWFDKSDGCETIGEAGCDYQHSDAICSCSR